MLPEPLNTLVKKPLLSLYILGSLFILIGGWVWWAKVSTNPQRVFWGTIEQSLATSAVTIEASQTSTTSSIHQTVQYSFGAANITHSLTTLKEGNTTVVDELIGTPTTDYTRYASIATTQKTKSGKPLNVASVTGIWAKNSTNGKGQLFSQATLGTGLPIGGIAIPIADFNQSTRGTLLQEIKNATVYEVSYNTVKKQTVDGRLRYTYNVAVEPVAYVELMQRFAQALGLHDLDSLDPSKYVGQSALQMQITIDVRSHHVVTASLPAAGATQTYSSYDVPVSVTVPANTITLQALQQRLTALQQ